MASLMRRWVTGSVSEETHLRLCILKGRGISKEDVVELGIDLVLQLPVTEIKAKLDEKHERDDRI